MEKGEIMDLVLIIFQINKNMETNKRFDWRMFWILLATIGTVIGFCLLFSVAVGG